MILIDLIFVIWMVLFLSNNDASSASNAVEHVTFQSDVSEALGDLWCRMPTRYGLIDPQYTILPH
jgi:hypothetical protein